MKSEIWMILKWREKKSPIVQYIPFRAEQPGGCHDSIEIEAIASGLSQDEAYKQARELELAQET